MNINALYRHPSEFEAEAMLSREQAYPDHFTPCERIAERLKRARTGLTHVMAEICPTLEEEQAKTVYCWLDKILDIVDIARIDAEGSVADHKGDTNA